MLILGIESSCDDTSISIVEDGKKILSNLISSQIDLHSKFGGIVPELASRQHILNINPLIEEALNQAKIDFKDIDAFAVTKGPGLQGSLLVGITTAKTLSFLLNKPLIGVNHLEGHIYSNFLAFPDLNFPLLVLLVSGGHTELIKVTQHRKYEVIGQTLDDAMGEAFDKVARLLELPYPGGPQIDKIAKLGNKKSFNFPRAIPDGFDFSFSGIKTSVLYTIQNLKKENKELNIYDLAASFQHTVVDDVVRKTIKASEVYNINQISLAGGVAANSYLRDILQKELKSLNKKLFLPPLELCTDNAAMIATAAYFQWKENPISNIDDLTVEPRLKL